MEPKVNMLVLHEVKKKNVKKGVRYLIRTHRKDGTAIWWVGDFFSNRERIWNKKESRYDEKEVFGSDLSELSFVPMDKIDAVYSLP